MPEYKSFRGPVSPEATLRWAFDLDGYTVLRQAAAFDTHPTEAEALALAPPRFISVELLLGLRRLLCLRPNARDTNHKGSLTRDSATQAKTARFLAATNCFSAEPYPIN